MKVILIDDWIYADIDGAVGIYGREEFLRNVNMRSAVCQAAFLNYEVKRIQEPTAEDAAMNALETSDAADPNITSREKLSDRSVQVFSASKEVIESIYRYLAGVKIQKLVPYGMALRAFLRSKDLLRTDEAVIFIDDLNKQGLVTVFEGDRMGVTRRIGIRDADHLVSEVKRSWQAFVTQCPRSARNAMRFKLVSNNEQWIDVFKDQGISQREDLVCIKEPFAVLEGLKSAEFTIHFCSHERLLAEKKMKVFRRRLMVVVMSSLLIVFGLGFWLLSFRYKAEQHKGKDEALRSMALMNERLRGAYGAKFKSFLRRQGRVDHARYYYGLIASLSTGWGVKTFTFTRSNGRGWIFEADLYPIEMIASLHPFSDGHKDMLQGVQEIVLSDVQGRRISLEIAQKDG